MAALPVALRRALREGGRALLDGLLPPHCPACGVVGDGLCSSCRGALVRRGRDGCRRCGNALGPDGRCVLDHRSLRGLSWAHAPFAYRATGGALVRRFKFRADGAAGDLLARAMADLAVAVAGPFHPRRHLLVPVPLHRARLRERGRDQAAELAAGVGRRLGLDNCAGVLQRWRPTLPQGDPRVTSRDGNVAGAFRCTRPARLAGRTVLLIDDVLTSGSTARECARVLAAAGAVAVGVLTAARS